MEFMTEQTLPPNFSTIDGGKARFRGSAPCTVCRVRFCSPRGDRTHTGRVTDHSLAIDCLTSAFGIDAPFCPPYWSLETCTFTGAGTVLAFARPLQPFQLVDGLIELAVAGRTVVAQDAVQIIAGRQAKRPAFRGVGV